MIELKLYSDGSERVPYRSGAFPLHVSSCALSMYPGMRCVSHWHGDHEFIVVEKGRCVFRVNGLPVALSAGEGLYVAPRNVHGVEAVNGEDCEHLCVVFPTALLGASAHMKDVIQTRLAVHEASRFVHLLPSVPKHREVLRGLVRLGHIVRQNARDAELLCLSVLYQLIADLAAAVRDEAALSKTDRNLSQIKDMIAYIQLHADRKLTLSDIARAGRLGRTSCENAFRRVLHTSPVQYLTDCRLERGMELLISTSLSVTEIAYACGFCSGSYFAEQFRRRSGCAPGDFRKKHRPPDANGAEP
jgi:AraC-like DNA-binding protein/mannose-6-phosphate isomerase-like protein (cupin superfamily)